MNHNKHTKLVKDVITNKIDFSKKEKKVIYKDYINAFKLNLIKTFFKTSEEVEILKRAKNIQRIKKSKISS
tara:strand:- start:113 stop:325 length:213 start_codon:yes stop_codon:yes gene_type:complete